MPRFWSVPLARWSRRAFYLSSCLFYLLIFFFFFKAYGIALKKSRLSRCRIYVLSERC
jgi:hypothetical protein